MRPARSPALSGLQTCGGPVWRGARMLPQRNRLSRPRYTKSCIASRVVDRLQCCCLLFVRAPVSAETEPTKPRRCLACNGNGRLLRLLARTRTMPNA